MATLQLEIIDNSASGPLENHIYTSDSVALSLWSLPGFDVILCSAIQKSSQRSNGDTRSLTEWYMKSNYWMLFWIPIDSHAYYVFQEIIEFPCLVVSGEDFQIRSKFHRFVKPHVHPWLTPFCTQLTGISQVIETYKLDYNYSWKIGLKYRILRYRN